jgi:hypothetical protein
MTENPQQDAVLADWAAHLGSALGVHPEAVDVDRILGLAGVVAHSVVRPAAPLSTYLAGVAAGAAIARGEDPLTAFAAADATVRAIVTARGQIESSEGT